MATLCAFALISLISLGISGGPSFGGQKVLTTGTYAGLFVPNNLGENSLGLFTVTIPRTGLGTGTAALFRNGLAYPGTMQAVADPDSANMTGVVDCSFNVTFTSQKDAQGNTTNTVVTYKANGGVQTQIKPNRNRISTASARLTGTGELTYVQIGFANSAPNGNSNGPIDYSVVGFKQAEAQ